MRCRCSGIELVGQVSELRVISECPKCTLTFGDDGVNIPGKCRIDNF